MGSRDRVGAQVVEHSAAQEVAELSWALWALGLAAGVWLAGVLRLCLGSESLGSDRQDRRLRCPFPGLVLCSRLDRKSVV